MKKVNLFLIIGLLILSGTLFFTNQFDELKMTGNAFLNTTTYSSSSDFSTGTFTNTYYSTSDVRLNKRLNKTGSLSISTWLNGAWDVSVSGDYAYVIAKNNDSINIINITNKSNLVNISHLSSGSAGATGWFADVYSISVSGDYAYTVASSNDSISIVNITNKSNPIRTGSLVETGTIPSGWLNAPYGISVSGDYAYVVSWENDSINIINITDKSNPIRTGSLVYYLTWFNDPSSVFVSGDYAYVTVFNNDSISIVNVTDKSNPIRTGSLVDTGAGTDGWLNGAMDVFVSGDYAYVATQTNSSINIINVTNKSNPTRIGSLTNDTWLGGAWNIFVSGDYAYVTSLNNNSINIIDITNKSNPTRIGSFNDTWLSGVRGISVSGDYAYVTQGNSINIINIGHHSSGSYESEVINATYIAKWVNLSLSKTLPNNTALTIAYRSCDDELCSGETYSAYTNDTTIGLSVTNNQYFQYKVNFTTSNLSASPQLNSVNLYFSDDVTAPSASMVCVPFNNRIGGIIRCTCSGSDDVSGLGINSTIVNGSSYVDITATEIGDHSVSGCSVTDIVGNIGIAIGSYKVLWGSGTSSSTTTTIATFGTVTLQKSHVVTQVLPGVETVLSGFSGTGVTSVSLEVNKETTNIKVKVSKYDSRPSAVSVDNPLKTYRYLQISTENLEENLTKAKVKFEVEKTWLTSNNLDKKDLTILKFDESAEKWNELETTYDSEDGNFYYYDIELDSFSFFAIGEKSKTSIISEIIGNVGDSYNGASGKEKGLVIWWAILGFLFVGIIIVGFLITREIITLKANNNLVQNQIQQNSNIISSY